jgi:uncharacterized protein
MASRPDLTSLNQEKFHYCNQFINSYLQWSNDFDGVPVLPLYLSRQAYVKAKVSAFAWKDLHIGHEDHEKVGAEAKLHFRLAGQLLSRPRGVAIVMSGVSGSGKSTIARLLCSHINMRRAASSQSSPLHSLLPSLTIRSDCVRKHLNGVPLDQTGPSSIYLPHATDLVYQAIQDYGLQALRDGWTVVFDAKYDSEDKRADLLASCTAIASAIVLVHVHAPRDVLVDRLLKRSADVSDATTALLDSQLQNFQAFSSSETPFLARIDTSAPDAANQCSQIVWDALISNQSTV